MMVLLDTCCLEMSEGKQQKKRTTIPTIQLHKKLIIK